MKHLRLFEEYENDKIIFVRTKKFNNSETIRKLPYEGIQCWAIYESDYGKYVEELELWGGYERDVEILDPLDKEIHAINYPMAHQYVMGEDDILPGLEVFDHNIHLTRFKKNEGKSMLEYSAQMNYQIILL